MVKAMEHTSSDVDPYEYAFGKLMGTALGRRPRLIDQALAPCHHLNEHPIVQMGREAMKHRRVAERRERLALLLRKEMEHEKDRQTAETQIARAMRVFDAAVGSDPIELREAVKAARRANARGEWTESV